jgi:hypothetical protein
MKSASPLTHQACRTSGASAQFAREGVDLCQSLAFQRDEHIIVKGNPGTKGCPMDLSAAIIFYLAASDAVTAARDLVVGWITADQLQVAVDHFSSLFGIGRDADVALTRRRTARRQAAAHRPIAVVAFTYVLPVPARPPCSHGCRR